MALLYEIKDKILAVETYVKVFDDHVEIRKPKDASKPTHSVGSAVAQGVKSIIMPKYTELIIPNNCIEQVEFKPANGALATGYLQFFIKGEKQKRVNFFTMAYHADAYNFNQSKNDTAKKDI